MREICRPVCLLLVLFVTYYLCRFGSKQMGSRTRILFNDEMDSFSDTGKNSCNKVKKGKRPKTAMSPAIILDAHRKVVMVIGASGGALIPSATAYVSV